MAIDLQADVPLLRRAVLATSVATLVVLTLAGARAWAPGWRSHQRAFQALGAVSKDRPLGIVQATTCTGDVDRCATCHLGAERKDLANPKVAQPLRGHSIPLAPHTAHGVGCTDCHGGTGRALDAAVAHAFPGETTPDPLMKAPHIQAGCTRCHVPGETPGMERVVHGSKVYAEYGCTICHPLSGDGRGGWDFGPDLRAGGRRSLSFLETSLTDPSANFPGSTMPSFQVIANADKEAFTDLVIFLESLELPRSKACSVRERSRGLAQLPCASCHAGDGGKASGRMRHRCAYILERKDQLACAGCHATKVPAPGAGGGICPVEHEHRVACSACHDDLSGGGQ